MSSDKLFYGNLPEVYGYGISYIGHSEKEVYSAIRKQYIRIWKRRNPNEKPFSFKERWEYYGGHIKEIEIGKLYCEDLRE